MKVFFMIFVIKIKTFKYFTNLRIEEFHSERIQKNKNMRLHVREYSNWSFHFYLFSHHETRMRNPNESTFWAEEKWEKKEHLDSFSFVRIAKFFSQNKIKELKRNERLRNMIAACSHLENKLFYFVWSVSFFFLESILFWSICFNHSLTTPLWELELWSLLPQNGILKCHFSLFLSFLLRSILKS